MKALGLTIILCSGILVLLFLLIPFGVTVQVNAYPDEKQTVNGQVRVAQVIVSNTGWFTQTVELPELTSCVGDLEVPLDAWFVTGNSLVPGAGQQRNIVLHAGETGTVYYVARESAFYDSMHVYYRQQYFSCLDPGTSID